MKNIRFTTYGLEGPTNGQGWFERQTYYIDDTVLIERFELDQTTLIDSKIVEVKTEKDELDAN
jgi:hypothetical protein